MLESTTLPHSDCPPPVDPQFVLATLKHPETLSKIDYILSQNGISTATPWLRLDVEANGDQSGLDLEAEDIRRLFASFGTVENVIIQPCQKGTAWVLMRDVVSAYLAQQILHQHYVQAYDARLYVRWSFTETHPPFSADTSPLAPPVSTSISTSTSTSTSAPPTSAASGTREATTTPRNQEVGAVESASGHTHHTEGEQAKPPFYANVYQEPSKPSEGIPTVKYTCRFDIQIANDKEFQVARKLIGAKGCNMKRIVDMCAKGCNGPVQDVIKLRLRGRGSGFKEGPNQQESEEPLHLCISSRYHEKYVLARHQAKELILNVYEDYKRFCDRTGKEPVVNLQIKLVENITGMRNQRQSGPMYRGNPAMAGHNHGYYQPHAGYYRDPSNGSRGPEPPYYPSGYPYYAYDPSSMYRPSNGTMSYGAPVPYAHGPHAEANVSEKSKGV
jgi:hypothetical protein